MKKLIMFTDSYPYRLGESFVLNEIPFLCKYYDEIIIITTISKGEKPLYDIPSNITLQPIWCKSFEKEKRKALRKGLGLLMKSNEEWKLTITIIHPTLKKKLYFCYVKALANMRYVQCEKAIKDIEVTDSDTLTLYNYWFHYMNYVAIQLKKNRFPKSILVSRAHRGDLYEEEYPFGFSPLKKYGMKYSDRVIPCSKMGETYLKNLFPEYAEKIAYSYLGTKDYGWNPIEEDCICRMVSCSYLVEKKRVDLLLRALSYLGQSNLQLEVVHFGDGPQKDKLIAMANQILPKNISFHFMGAIRNEDLMVYYQKNHVELFINVSSTEGVPVSIMEAMSFGIPAVATDVGGTSELVDNACGYLIDKEEKPKEIANIIYQYLSLSKLEKMKTRQLAREKWKRSFSAEINYTDFIHNKLN